MNWVQKNIEQTVLLGILLLILVVSVLIGSRFEKPTAEAIGASRTWKAPDLSAYSALSQEIKKYVAWVEPDQIHNLFISRKMEWLKKEQKLAVYDATTADDYGVPRDWKAKYNISLSDPQASLRDDDGDGFMNLDEFKAQTDPKNKESLPPFISKLRIERVSKSPYLITFKGSYDDGGTTVYQLNFGSLTDEEKKSGMKASNAAKIGDKLGPWTVLAYHEKKGQRMNDKMGNMMEYDESELELSNAITGDKITLVLKKDFDYPTIVGLLVFDIDGTRFNVKRAQDFDFKGTKYKVISIDESHCVIQNVETKENVEITNVRGPQMLK